MKELYQEYDVKMQKTIEVVVSDFAGVRAGRANAAVLDKITVEYYGTETPIQQVASISTPDARTGDPALGRNPAQGGGEGSAGLRAGHQPPERRQGDPPDLPPAHRGAPEELTKQVKKYGEGGKVAIRNIRRDALEAFKKMQKAPRSPRTS